MTDDLAKRVDSLVVLLNMERKKSLSLGKQIEKLEAVIKDDARWLAAYHLWCEMKGCAPASSDLIAARKILEGKDD